jgi:hypothetical protein
LSLNEKLHPFDSFLRFLRNERASFARLAESTKSRVESSKSGSSHHGFAENRNRSLSCAVHKDAKHKTSECCDFVKLSLDEKYKALRKVHACFKCFELHRRDKCTDEEKCTTCGLDNHHSLLCKRLEVSSGTSAHSTLTSSVVQSTDFGVSASSNNASHDLPVPSLYAIQQAPVAESGKLATIFFDNGSNTTYITHKAAERLKAKVVGN